jgi:probable phosphoglycerate mutase
MRILIVRHGETEWNRLRRFQGRSDVPLNQKGKEQALALALALKKESFTAMYSSPLSRAMETAGFIKSFHPSIPLIPEEGLIEMDLGEFDGIGAKQWGAQYPDYRKAWQDNPSTVKMPGGESLKEVQIRALNTLKRITKPYVEGSTLLLCTHNFVISSILCHALEMPLDRFREIRQGTAALNIIHKQGERFRVDTVNERSHLNE